MNLSEKVRLAVEDAFSGRDVVDFSELSGGHAHDTVLVQLDGGHEYVMKIFGLGELEERWRESFETEPLVLDMLDTESEIPAPEPVSGGRLEADETLIYHFMEKMTGKCPDGNAAGYYFTKLSRESKKNIMRQIGRNMAVYHRDIGFGCTGPLKISGSVLDVDSRDSWESFFLGIMKEWTPGISDPFKDMENRILSAVEKNLDLIGNVDDYVLLHRELDAKNILIKDGNLSAILDWEWCASGHNEFDLAVVEGRMLLTQFRDKSLWKYYRKSLYSGYRRTGELEEGWEQRRQLYLLFPLVWDMNFYRESWDKPAELYRERAESLIESLE